jgi:hypothetical protein
MESAAPPLRDSAREIVAFLETRSRARMRLVLLERGALNLAVMANPDNSYPR